VAIDIVFSGPAQLDIDFATAPNLEVDLLPEHRLGQHVDFDDSDQTVGYVITRQADGTFAMEAGGGGGSATWLGLTDTPASYSGQALKVVRVNSGASALEFATAGAGDMLVATYDPGGVSEQLVGRTATQTLTNKSISASQINSGTLANARISESSVTQHEAAIDHDALLNFAASEHFTKASINLTDLGDVAGKSGAGTVVVLDTSPTFSTSLVLDQVTADYTISWANPAGARALQINDPGGGDTFVFEQMTQTLAGKTLTLPTVGDFTNANHDHEDAAGGGQLDFNAVFGGFQSGSPPSTPSDGDLWFDTTEKILFYWDNGRSKWLSVHLESFTFSRSGSNSDNSWLRMSGHVIADQDPGWNLIHNYTIVAANWACQTASTGFGVGSTVEVRKSTPSGGGAAIAFQLAIESSGVLTHVADDTIDHDVDAAPSSSAELHVQLNLTADGMVAGTVSQATCTVWLRRRYDSGR
tara:strand:+ start:1626 stop:3038 length:1413 start_codon:yes stop_codon:yes gene_type:complete